MCDIVFLGASKAKDSFFNIKCVALCPENLVSLARFFAVQSSNTGENTMKTNRKLGIINSEPNFQKRLGLLVSNGFKSEATELIQGLARTHTVILHYDWHDAQLCRPLVRVTEGHSAVYVIISSSSRIDNPHEDKSFEWRVIFEYGWLRKVLGWDGFMIEKFTHLILAQALARPLNQWSLNQAEGMSRIARSELPDQDPLAREIIPLHLVYQLRQGDFGHIKGYLVSIKDFPFLASDRDNNEEGVVNWIVEKLISYGWTPDRIRKELVEWITLKTNAWPAAILGVAKAKIFASDDQVRAVAIRRWLSQAFDNLLDMACGREDKEVLHCKNLRELLLLSQFDFRDTAWITEKLVSKMAVGEVAPAAWFWKHFLEFFAFDSFDKLTDEAIAIALEAKNYDAILALHKETKKELNSELTEIIHVLGIMPARK